MQLLMLENPLLNKTGRRQLMF